MKNIYLRPTDNPSRLFFNNNKFSKKFELTKGKPFINGITNTQNYFVYIISDEEIKEEDFVYDKTSKTITKIDFIKDRGDGILIAGVHTINLDDNYIDLLSNFKKIILTTDQDLIKDGVQSIDDEFLEWFVKNPSCEEVDVRKMCYGALSGFADTGYKIVIPKEEPKQETFINDTDSHSWGFENFEVIKTEEDGKIFVETLKNIPEPNDKLKKAFRDFKKQETLEEVAENYGWRIKRNTFSDAVKANELAESAKQDFIAGAKWQSERMYSEEDMIEYSKYHGTLSPKDWFKQFKKK